MESNELYAKELRKSRVLACALLVAAPLLYLIIALIVKIPEKSGGEHDMMFYILWVVGVVEPALGLLIGKVQLRMYRNRKDAAMTPAQFFFNISIIRMAMAEAVFIFGFIVYQVSGDIARMLAFYPVGIVWLFVYWPRQSSLDRYRKLMESK